MWDKEIIQALPIGKFRAILEPVAEESDTEDIASIKAIIILIEKRLKKERIDKGKRIARAQEREQN